MRINSINNTNTLSSLNQTSFKAKAPEKLNGLAGFYQNLATKNAFQKGVRFFSRSDKSFTHIMALESVILSSFYMLSTLTNDKIEKDQKPQMIINDTLTLGFSTAGAYLTDSKVKKSYGNFVENFLRKHRNFYSGLNNKAEEKPLNQLLNTVERIFNRKENGQDVTTELNRVDKILGSKYHLKNIVGKDKNLKAFQITKDEFNKVVTDVKDSIASSKTAKEAKEKVRELTTELYKSSGARAQADIVNKGFRSIRTLAVFGIIYRYIGPVLVTPVANKLSSMFFPNKN